MQKWKKYSRNTYAKKEEIETPGYSFVYRNDRSENNGGLLIRVRGNINISLELTFENQVG